MQSQGKLPELTLKGYTAFVLNLGIGVDKKQIQTVFNKAKHQQNTITYDEFKLSLPFLATV